MKTHNIKIFRNASLNNKNILAGFHIKEALLVDDIFGHKVFILSPIANSNPPVLIQDDNGFCHYDINIKDFNQLKTSFRPEDFFDAVEILNKKTQKFSRK